MSRSKKFLIVILLFLTLITGGFAIFIGLQTRDSSLDDVSVTTFGCSAAVGGYWIGGSSGNCNFCQSVGVGVKASDSKMCCNLISKSDSRWGQWGCETTLPPIDQCTVGFPRPQGAECNPACGGNSCDGAGPLDCNQCTSGSKIGKFVCSAGGPPSQSYFSACGMTKVANDQACTFDLQCQDSAGCIGGICGEGNRSGCGSAFGRINNCVCTLNSQCSSNFCQLKQGETNRLCKTNPTGSSAPGTQCSDSSENECVNSVGGINLLVGSSPKNLTSKVCIASGRFDTSNRPICALVDKSDGGTSGGGGAASSGTTAQGQPCTPGFNQCVAGTFCTPNAQGQNICNGCPGGAASCGAAFCAVGTPPGTCGQIIALKCTGDFGTECTSSDPGVQEQIFPAGQFQQALNFIAGCGQVDIVCSGGSNNKQLCGDFTIVRNSCGGGGGGDNGGGGNPPNPPGTLSCNSQCYSGVCALQAQCTRANGGSWCTNVSRCFPSSAAAQVNCIASESVAAINQRIDTACSLGSCASGLVCDVSGSRNCRLPSNITSPTCTPPVVITPFCGDAVCQAGELCERAGTTGPAANEFRQCSNNQAISSCRNLATSAPSLANGCTFCGDGVFQSSVEQCDATAASGGGNDPANCNAQCQTVAPICIGMTQNPTFVADTVSSGVGNIVEYELTYQNASTTDPYPSIRLRVADPGFPTVPVGRDADNPTNTLVAPAVAPTRNTTNSTWTYRFRWEPADTAAVDLPDASYDIRALLDGTNATSVTSPAGCLEGITVDALVAEEPVFTVVKQGGLVCQAENSARIDYTISVTNSGPVAGSIDFVRDTLDPAVIALGITPTGIVPTFGTYSSGAITWVGNAGDLAFIAGQTKTYTYSITIPSTQVTSFRTTGVNNTVQVQYDTGTTTDNTTEFDLTTPMSCSIIVIPVTSIFTDSTRFLLMGMIFIIGGYTIYRYRIGATQVQGFLQALTRPLNFESMVLHDEKFRERGGKKRRN